MREERLTLDIGAALYGMLVEKLRCGVGGAVAARRQCQHSTQQSSSKETCETRDKDPQILKPPRWRLMDGHGGSGNRELC
jgi:hypothetical protein